MRQQLKQVIIVEGFFLELLQIEYKSFLYMGWASSYTLDPNVFLKGKICFCLICNSLFLRNLSTLQHIKSLQLYYIRRKHNRSQNHGLHSCT